MDKNLVLLSTAIIYRENKKKKEWLIVKQEKDSAWEFPTIAVRRAESSAKAAIRLAGEQLGMNARVIEEVGRAGGSTTINGKIVPQRQLYYLMRLRVQTGEILTYAENKWLDYALAVRKLPTKRDRQMIKDAKKEVGLWHKKLAERKRRAAP